MSWRPGANRETQMTMHSAPHQDGLTLPDFDRIARYVREVAGIQLAQGKHMMVESRLRRMCHAEGFATIGEFCADFFDNGPSDAQRTALLNAVTTNKTDFFREPKHFDHLMGVLIPQLVQAGQSHLRVWSAACSTGAEPYTLAMLLEQNRQKGGPSWEMLATDLDTEVLRAAHRGIFHEEMVTPVPPELRRAFIHDARDKKRREVRIVPALRAKIAFGRLNLMDARYAVGQPKDVIFCRNVLIYFDKPTQEKVVSRLANALVLGGHLYLGHSESISGFDLPLRQVANTVFEKV